MNIDGKRIAVKISAIVIKDGKEIELVSKLDESLNFNRKIVKGKEQINKFKDTYQFDLREPKNEEDEIIKSEDKNKEEPGYGDSII